MPCAPAQHRIRPPFRDCLSCPMQGARKTQTLPCVVCVVLYIMHAGAMQPPAHGAGTCATAQSLHCGGDAVPSSLPRAWGAWPSAGVMEHGVVLPAALLAGTQRPMPPVARSIPQSSEHAYGAESPAPPVARSIPQSSEHAYSAESPAPPVARGIPQSSEHAYGAESAAPPVARGIPQSSEHVYGAESPAPPVARSIPQSSDHANSTYTQNTGAASCSDCCA
jgi:hypothetical protein